MLILPVVTVTGNLIHFLIALPILIGFLLFEGSNFNGSLLTLPIIIVIQFAFTLSLCLLVATFNVRFRDTEHILGVVILLGFYMTPVFYDASGVPETYKLIYTLNPMMHVIEAYRDIFLRGLVPQLRSILFVACISAITLFFGYKSFLRSSYRFAEEL